VGLRGLRGKIRGLASRLTPQRERDALSKAALIRPPGTPLAQGGAIWLQKMCQCFPEAQHSHFVGDDKKLSTLINGLFEIRQTAAMKKLLISLLTFNVERLKHNSSFCKNLLI